jgi:eukaryotic translation initiation factor 2C
MVTFLSIHMSDVLSKPCQALNVVIRMDPNLRFPFNTRSFFTEDGKRSIGGGMELWRGYFQSIRPSQGRMYLNLDIATGIMFKEGPLIQLCLEYLNDRDVSRLSQGRLQDRDRISLQRFLTNLRVSTNHSGRTQTRVIRKLTQQGANAVMFTMRDGGPSISVADYFRRELNKPLKYPNLICVEVARVWCQNPSGAVRRP